MQQIHRECLARRHARPARTRCCWPCRRIGIPTGLGLRHPNKANNNHSRNAPAAS
ncbi:hypothetical protein BKA56DRAFT_581826 [Ilyonectria sp. MPI-CAGE-AT-0026]|nr:hypothetical protein BKA56DRAFT_581826 [Ilyonectria sp. MPI-CAGE-AT-0026]